MDGEKLAKLTSCFCRRYATFAFVAAPTMGGAQGAYPWLNSTCRYATDKELAKLAKLV